MKKPEPPIVRPLPDWDIGAVALKMQQTTWVSIFTGLPVVIIGPLFVKPARDKKRRKS